MRIELTPDQENQVNKIAVQAGRNADDVVGEMFERFLTEEARFIAAVDSAKPDSIAAIS
jgi:hypothetical protein